MTNCECNDNPPTPAALWIEIRIQGRLEPRWQDWFGELTLFPLDTGQTRLCGALPDQAALHGVLERIRDLNLSLVWLQVGECRDPDRPVPPEQMER